jgi:hypothetical protein
MQDEKLQADIGSKRKDTYTSERRRWKTETRDKTTGMSMLVLLEENANI